MAVNRGGFENWGEVKKLVASDGAAGDDFGNSVAISNGAAVVGAPVHDSGLSVDRGTGYFFSITCEPPCILTLTCPGNITAGTEANQCSKVVTYPAPTVGGDCQNPSQPICNPPSGSVFAKGVTAVNCSVSDSSGATASCSFTVSVNDNQNPTINCPGNISTSAPPFAK